MPDPIIYDPRPLLTFVDAPPVAALCVGVVLGVVLAVVFAGATVLVRNTRPAKHRPTGGSLRIPAPPLTPPREGRHTSSPTATRAMTAVHPSYLGPQPVTTGGAR